MKRQIITGTILLSVALFMAVAYAQQKKEHALAPAKSEDAQALVKQLGSPHYKVRRKAEQELMKLGQKAVPALKKAVKESRDAHIRYLAQRLLDNLHQAPAARGPVPSPWPAPGDLQDQMRRFEQQFDGLLNELQNHGLLGPDDLSRLRHMLSGPGGTTGKGFSGTFSGRVQSQGRTIELHVKSDGHVMVKVTENGKTKSYKADSMKDLKSSQPDVYRDVKRYFGSVVEGRGPGRMGFGFSFGNGPRSLSPMPVPVPRHESPLKAAPGRGGNRFELGIWVDQPSDALRSQLDLGPHAGLVVESVVPGGTADKLGVQRYDVLTELNGRPIGSVGDVHQALADVGPGGKISVSLIRKGKALKLTGTR